ncbi:MAG: carbamoyltransferase HypF [Deltaproteobacteria bacterium]|nr:carbamoyltransferase HypF [Deltaproteobacteria bacterium]
MTASGTLSQRKLRVTGIVQGVGFRPFVYRLARNHNLAGWVCNTSRGVEIQVAGPPESLESFVQKLSTDAPALARIDAVLPLEAEPWGQEDFRILESQNLAGTEALIPADVSTCEDCFREIMDPGDRRFLYAFTNCTNCGPRFTIIREVPYDRPQTTMAAFAMCPQCREEYEDPEDRRFHAEPTACPRCGPRVWLEENQRRIEEDALKAAGRLLGEGKIVAIKGLGGFHLAADVRSEAAVMALRDRKGRVAKPFAVMVRDLAEAELLGELGDLERSLLLSPERPIVLVKRRDNGPATPLVAPGNNYVGLMLPYTPLHMLLFEYAPPALVMTSGNLSEEPLEFTNEGARTRLGALADALLLHNRDIQAPCDDSVVRPLEDGKVIPIRRARGFVPRSISLPLETASVLGVGAEQKNTFCLAWGRTALLSQHIGDLDTAETFDYYCYAIRHFAGLCRQEPRVIAHDLHPQYLSTRYAREQEGVRLIGVQHHHAHIAACLAENGRTEKCLGVALDGTGYGTDGTVWGGEILVADLAEFSRAGHLVPVRLPGGEAAVRHPGRMAAAYLQAAYGDDFAEIAASLGLPFSPLERQVLERQLATGLNSPLTSSAGRLFDAVAAALGVCRDRTYEGQPAVELEMIAAPDETGFYPVPLDRQGETPVLDTPALFREVVEDYRRGAGVDRIAARFHNSLVRLLAAACEEVRARTGLSLAVLSGGVFQNARIFTGLRRSLEESGFEVLFHTQAPPNDGGISLGQVAVAAARLLREKGE